MQRLFSMFPTGWPGVALLALRLTTSISLLTASVPLREALPGWAEVAALLTAAFLAAGHLTPIVAVLAVLFHGFLWWRFGVGDAHVPLTCVNAIALALLGPGAYSIDAYRFGRRLVELDRF